MKYEFYNRDDRGVLKIQASSFEEERQLYDLYNGIRSHCGPGCTLKLACIENIIKGQSNFIEFFVEKKEELKV